MTPADVAAYPAWRRALPAKRPAGPATINRGLAHLGALFTWLVDTERLEKNPVQKVKKAREYHDTRQIVIVEAEAFDAMCAKLDPSWRVAAEALLVTGMRWSSLVRLRPEHLDDARKVVRLVRPKGKRDLEIGVASERGWAALRAVAAAHHFAADVGGFNKALKFACERAGVPRVTAHCLRHTAAVRWLRLGVDVNQVRAWLGHADLQTTQKYLRFAVIQAPPALV